MFGALAGLGSKFLGGDVLSGLFGAAGGGAMLSQLKQGRDDIMNMPGMSGPQSFGGNFGQIGADGQFQMDQGFQNAQNSLAGSLPNMLQGGLFNNAGFQQAFNQNDIAGALGQANSAFGQQAGSSAFGGLGNLYSQLAGQVQGGPQDLSGGLMGGLFNQGFGNQLTAGDQSGLESNMLNVMRQRAQPQNDREFNKMNDRLFSMGMLGQNTTNTGEAYRGFNEALNSQDLGFQQAAVGMGLDRGNFLANLGNSQIGLGQGFLGQNMGQFNQNIGNMMGLEGQGFNQALQGLNFNTSQGMNRLQSAQGLFGMGSDVFNQNFGLGLSGAEGMLGFGDFGLQAARTPAEIQAGLLSGSSGHARALGDLSGQQAEASGGLFGGIGKAIGGLFG